MARSRNIKPGFFINDELAEIDPLGRLLFIGLWTIADREGRLEYRPARIKVETLPYDDCDIEKLLEDLETRSFILTYFHEGSRYIQITNFSKHQNPHRNEKESEIPAPEVIEKLPEHSETTLEITGTVQEMHSTNRADSLNLIPDSGFLTPDNEPTVLVAEKPATLPIPYQEIVDLYHNTCPSLPRVLKLNSKRKAAIKARYKEHGTDGLTTLFKKAEESDFLSGRSGRWTACNLDWLLKDSNCLKVLEGNYSNSPFETKDKIVAEDFTYKEPEQDRSRFAFLNQDDEGG